MLLQTAGVIHIARLSARAHSQRDQDHSMSHKRSPARTRERHPNGNNNFRQRPDYGKIAPTQRTIMYTMNTGTKAIPMTYSDRRRESERLLKITQEMDKAAFENPEGFLNDHFRELDDAFRITVQNLTTLL
jgi:hypothetical protein